MSRVRLVVATLILAAHAAPIAAQQQPRSRARQPRTSLDLDAGLVAASSDTDPIGVDLADGLDDRRAGAPGDAGVRAGPEPAHVAAQAGEALTAISGIRESDHDVVVELADGLARVSVAMRFVSGAHHAAELRYRLAVPSGAALESLEVCSVTRAGRACRRGVADPAAGELGAYDDAVLSRAASPRATAMPVAHALAASDSRGASFVVRAAAIAPRGELTVRVEYVAPAPLRGGVARVVLPARGMDPRAAESAITVRASDLVGASIGGAPAGTAPFTADPWHPVEITATARTDDPVRATAWSAQCGARRCARLRVAAGPREGAPVDLVLFIDASPSTEGPPRGRIGPALAALLASAPAGSRVRALAFGARAQAVVAQPTDAARLALAPLADAVALDLGSATRFEAAWALARPWLVTRGGRARRGQSLRSVVAIVGDGGLTTGDASNAAFAEAARLRIEIDVINVADRATWPVLRDRATATGGTVIDAGDEAGLAERGRGVEALEQRLAALFAPVVAAQTIVRAGVRRIDLGSLRAGEERVWEGAVAGRGAPSIAAGRASKSAAPAPSTLAAALGVRLAQVAGERDPRRSLVAIDPADLRVESAVAALARRRGRPLEQRGRASACVERGPATRASGVSSDAAPVALAEARACGSRGPAPRAPARAAASTLDGRGVPAETMLQMLRQRIVPIARGCFRRDRAGRADYQTRAEFLFRLADREVIVADVQGAIRPPLRSCLMRAIDTLDVPRFEGTVVVRYPLVTEPELAPPVLQLTPGLAASIDRAFPEPR